MYQIFDLALESDLPLPELLSSDSCATGKTFRIHVDTQKGCEQLEPVWSHEWRDDNGNVSIACGRQGKDYVLSFPDNCCYQISLGDNAITCYPEPDIAEETVRHLLLDQVIPRMLGQSGRLILHASAVAMAKNSGVAFVGDSGWGKSTIASSFYETGSKLLTDDCLLVTSDEYGLTGIPNYHGLRLYQDSAHAIFGDRVARGAAVAHYTNKHRLVLPDGNELVHGEPARLTAMFLLNDPTSGSVPDNISIDPISGAEEMMVIIRQMFVLDPTNTELMAAQFALVSQLIGSKIPIFRLSYPRQHTLLAAVRQAVMATLQDNGIR